MDKRDEEYLLRTTYENNRLLKDNNKMLKQIINVLNYYILHAQEENDSDFNRNIIANMVSNLVDLRFLKRK